MATSFDNQVNGILKKMRQGDIKQKGDQGEMAAFAICEKIYQKYGGLLYHSYAYKVDKALPGNIKFENNQLFCENLGGFTEIDILYVSPFRVIPIEVKSYKAAKIILTDDKISGCYKTNKSPVHQNEMHCRHLLAGIFEALPDGNENYIRPLVTFVDSCKLYDKRSEFQKDYIRISVLNNMKSVIEEINTPLNGKFINFALMEERLHQIQTDCSKKLPPRYI